MTWLPLTCTMKTKASSQQAFQQGLRRVLPISFAWHPIPVTSVDALLNKEQLDTFYIGHAQQCARRGLLHARTCIWGQDSHQMCSCVGLAEARLVR